MTYWGMANAPVQIDTCYPPFAGMDAYYFLRTFLFYSRHQSWVLRRGHRRRRGDDDVQPDEVGGRHEPTRRIILRRAVMPHTHGRDVREHRREVVRFFLFSCSYGQIY